MPSQSPTPQKKGFELVFSGKDLTTDQIQVPGSYNAFLSPAIECSKFSGLWANFLWTATTGSNPELIWLYSSNGEKYYKINNGLLVGAGTLPRMAFMGALDLNNAPSISTTTARGLPYKEFEDVYLYNTLFVHNPPWPFMKFYVINGATTSQTFDLDIFGVNS